jgi:hypothetical protein
MVWDPLSKIKRLTWVSEIITKIDSVVVDLIKNLLNTKIVKLWTSYVKKFDELSVKLVGKFDKAMQEHIIWRLAIIDDEVLLKKYLDNSDEFINSFKDGRYPVLSKPWTYSNWYYVWYKNGIFINKDLSLLEDVNYDFIVQNWEIKFWVWHSAISWWKNVDFAGTIHFDSNWIPYSWSNNSWHYKTLSSDRKIFIDVAKKQFYWFDFSNIYFNSVINK